MKNSMSFKEKKIHGSPLYAFEMYKMNCGGSNLIVTPHWHDETEIIYVLDGEISISVNGNRYSGKKGDIFVVNNGEIHEILSGYNGAAYDAFVFDLKSMLFAAEDLAQKKFLEPVNSGEVLFKNKILDNCKMREILEHIKDINENHTYSYTLMTKALILQFIAMLFDDKQYCEEKINSAKENKYALQKKIITYIRENLSSRITLDETARRFNMSSKYFCRFFKNNFHKTLVEYITSVRMEKALELLSDTDMSVTDIALECGFSNMSYFAQTFRTSVGISPREYRNILLKEQER